ncbi:MAG: RNA pyrophosphohydrolase [Granulosicoccaceae bacterium]
MIDAKGFRPNVGIILSNQDNQLLWARRIGQDAWQFPQGGIRKHESTEDALYRELHEEVGLAPEQVEIIARSREWLTYRLPKHLLRHNRKPLCIGQKQRWFLLRLTGDETDVRLDRSDTPEFDHWRWVEYWQPLREVVAFKRDVYRSALREFETLLF